VSGPSCICGDTEEAHSIAVEGGGKRTAYCPQFVPLTDVRPVTGFGEEHSWHAAVDARDEDAMAHSHVFRPPRIFVPVEHRGPDDCRICGGKENDRFFHTGKEDGHKFITSATPARDQLERIADALERIAEMLAVHAIPPEPKS
jgi:hypothetical protein